jgi:hypothetical protein
VARDRDLFALLDEVEQLAEFVLGFKGANLAHGQPIEQKV